VKKIVAVQDCGLIISRKTAESQVYGAITMAMSGALFEERIYDEQTGRMLNPDMEFNKMTGFGDTPEIVVHMMAGVYDSRGVIGLGEPPVVSPIAAISNAVANAIGARVPTVPMTPDKVLAVLETARRT
jgi:xanthine dehydrogenase YagR molybdenum-binding subunit